ncbi:hypothetical protein [Streptomyces sp. NPDC046631]
MTWPTAPELIAAVLGVIAVAMICASQHGIGTTNPQTETPKEHPQT